MAGTFEESAARIEAVEEKPKAVNELKVFTPPAIKIFLGK